MYVPLCVCVCAFVVCLSEQSSCGCCLMQEQVRRTELHFNGFYEEIKKEMIKMMTNLDAMRGGMCEAVAEMFREKIINVS